jgi:hypothetical protein
MIAGMIKPRFGLMALSITLALSSSASAQTAVAKKLEARIAAAVTKIQEACSSDLAKYCSAVTPGEGRLIFCVMAHEDKLSDKCDYALYTATRNLGRALDRLEQTADACGQDIETHCSEGPGGGGRIAQCLISKKASLSKGCRTAINRFSVKN